MTDKISDEAKRLAMGMRSFGDMETDDCFRAAKIQAALTAARNGALEEAANFISHERINKRCGTSLILDLSAAIRAMKGQS